MQVRDGRNRNGGRWGGALAETAIVSTAALLLLIGMMSTGLGVYRYQQMAALSREGARWAAVHGPNWQASQGQPRPTSVNVMTNSITPKAAGLDLTKMTCTLNWPSPVGTAPAGMVSVTLTYLWTPEAYFTSTTLTLTSTSTVPITY